MARVSVLGSTEATVDGELVELRSRRQRRVLAALVLHRAGASIDRLADAVWGQRLPKDPPAALANQIARLRALLGSATSIEATRGGYRLNELVACDVAEFDDLLAAAPGHTDPAERAEHLQRAAALWRGPVAYEDLDSDAAGAEAVRLGELCAAATEERAAALLDAGVAGEAIAILEALCHQQPLRERPRLVLAEALASTGRRADALRTLEDLRRRLVTDLGLSPSGAFGDVEHRVLAGEVQSIPAGWSFPRVAAPVFGRDGDVIGLDALIATSRLVTLTGAGGVGKTTLAKLVGTRATTRFPDGASFVDLTDAEVDSDVATVVARQLRLDRQGDDDWTVRIVDVLGGRHMLLVLDNAEHVVEGAARVAGALVERTDTHLVVTSRTALSLPGERLWPVEPLPVTPDPDNAAITLFCDRARAVRPNWSPAVDQVPVVADLCDRLDGLPFAIELAAAQLRFLTLDELAATVAGSLDALAGTPRRNQRHDGLRASLDWSYRSLEPPHDTIFDWLAVFNGGFTEDTAAAVCKDLLDPGPLTAALHELVRRSLLTREDRSYGTRYRFLQTTRAYAAEHLRRADRLGEVSDAHATAIAALFSRAVSDVFGPEEERWVDRLEDECPNLLATHRRLIQGRETELALRLAVDAYLVAFPRRRADVAALPADALRLVEDSDVDADLEPLVAEALGVAADNDAVSGNHAAARERVARGLALASAAGVAGADRYCLAAAADLALYAGDVERAADLHEVAQVAFAEHGQPALAAWMAASAALARSHQRHPDEQVGPAVRALDDATATGSSSAIAFCRYAVAEVARSRDAIESRGQLEQAVSDADAVGAAYVAGLARLSLATMSLDQGDHAGAARQYRALLDLWRDAGNWTQQWNTLHTAAVLLGDAGYHVESTIIIASIHAQAPTPPWGSDADEIAKATDRNRAALEPATYAEADERGRFLVPAEVVAVAQQCLANVAVGNAQLAPSA